MKWSDIQPSGDQPSTDQPPKLKWSDIGKTQPVIDTAEPPDRAVEAREAARGTDADALSAEASPFGGSSGVLQRVWDGMLGKDVSRMGRFGMGLADPVFGGAQIGARMGPEIGGAAYERPEQTRQRLETVDTATQRREESYQQREKAAGLSLPENAETLERLWHGLTTEGPRLGGNIAATAPLAAIPAAGATVPARIGLGAAAGALGGAQMPVTGQRGQTPNFLREKLKQAGYGALGGAAGQAVGEAIPPVARAIGQSMRAPPGLRPPEPPVSPTAPMPPAVQQQVQQKFQQAAPMSTSGINNAGDIAKMQQSQLAAAQSVVAEKPNLSFDTPKGSVSGRLPYTRMENAQAIGQAKMSVFQKFDKMAKDTETGINPETSTINKHKKAWADAQRDIADANEDLRQANTVHTLMKAQQHNVGDDVYRLNAANAAEKAARVDVRKARLNVDMATRRAERARADLRKPWVDLKPATSELQKFASDKALKLAGKNDVLAYAAKQAKVYAKEEAASPMDVQRAIAVFNDSLQAYYKTPNFETAARAGVDALIANRLRAGLDEVITKIVGPGYQAEKLRYGALSAVEKDVTRAAARSLGNSPDSKLIDGLTNVMTGEELARGLAHLSADPIMGAVAARAGRSLFRYFNSPDRAVRSMYQMAERSMRGQDRGFLRNVQPYVGGPVALGTGEQMQERPKVGDRGPLGGRIIATTPVRRDVPAGP